MFGAQSDEAVPMFTVILTRTVDSLDICSKAGGDPKGGRQVIRGDTCHVNRWSASDMFSLSVHLGRLDCRKVEAFVPVC